MTAPEPERRTSTAPLQPADLGALGELVAAVEAARFPTPASAARLLAAAQLRTEDLLPWADFDHPVADSYGRKLVASGPCFELMVMSWAPGDYSAIHDHGGTQWGAVRYFGLAAHVTFREDEGRLCIGERGVQEPGSVCAVDHDLIHLMGNAGTTPFLSLHLYGVDAPAGCVTGDARVFDLDEGRIQRTNGGVFYALPESEIRRREPCPAADDDTMLLHHRLMLDRVGRILAAGQGNATLRRRHRRVGAALARLGPVT